MKLLLICSKWGVSQFFSAAMINKQTNKQAKHLQPKAMQGRKGFISASSSRSQFIIEGSQYRNSKQEPRVDAVEEGCLLASLLAHTQLAFCLYNSTHLPRNSAAYSGLALLNLSRWSILPLRSFFSDDSGLCQIDYKN